MGKYYAALQVSALQEKWDANTMVYPLRKLLWMGFKNNDISQEKTFKHYNYAKTAKLYPYTGAIKNEISEDLYKISLKEFCEALQTELLYCFIGTQSWKIHWKTFALHCLF